MTAPGDFRARWLRPLGNETDVLQADKWPTRGEMSSGIFPQTSSSLFFPPFSRILSRALSHFRANAFCFPREGRDTSNHNAPKAMTERELIDRTAAEAALEVDATADDEEEQGGLATAETTAVERAATHRARAIPRVAIVGFRASGGGARGGRSS